MVEVKTRIGKRFSVIIPKEIREKLGLKEGDLIVIKKIKNEIVITPEKISPFEKLANLLGKIQYDNKTEEEVESYLLNFGREKNSGDS